MAMGISFFFCFSLFFFLLMRVKFVYLIIEKYMEKKRIKYKLATEKELYKD